MKKPLKFTLAHYRQFVRQYENAREIVFLRFATTRRVRHPADNEMLWRTADYKSTHDGFENFIDEAIAKSWT